MHRLNHYPMDKLVQNNCVIYWIVIYPVDSAIHLLNNRVLLYNHEKHIKCRVVL